MSLPSLRRAACVCALAALVLTTGASSAVAGPAPAPFPRGFLWGVATSAFQTEAGQGKNVDRRADWFTWTHDAANIADRHVTDDKVENGPGDYARYKQDVDLAHTGIGANAYRFSVEWSRIFPRSTASVKTKGTTVTLADLKRLDHLADQSAVRHYAAVLQRIHQNGMTPFLTLNHFTLPTWLHDPIATRDALAGIGTDAALPKLAKGGWLNTSTVAEFRKYAAYLAWKYGKQVRLWSPLNEPMVVAVNGYVNVAGAFAGWFPPGADSYAAAIRVVLNLVAANRAAYDQIHRWDRSASVGLVQNMIGFTPADPAKPVDVAATDHADYLFNRLFLDAAVKGISDTNANEIVDPGERNAKNANKADFIGVNYYFRGRVTGLGTAISTSIPILDFLPATGYRTALAPTAALCPTTCSDFGSEIYPAGFAQALREAGAYGKPMYITENGMADATDAQRPQFLMDHLRVVQTAITQEHLPIRGYFQWSPTDNFEWSSGYLPKFGLSSFDPVTLKRTLRPASVKVFKDSAKADALTSALQAQYPATP